MRRALAAVTALGIIAAPASAQAPRAQPVVQAGGKPGYERSPQKHGRPSSIPEPPPIPLPLPAAPPNNRPKAAPPRGAKKVAKQAAGAYQAIAPRAALVFDVTTGQPLFSISPDLKLPIASLTKMMTALIVAGAHSPDERMLISAKAAAVPGSRIGVLPKGKMVPLGPVFVGMLLVSGNDAAEALAEHDAGSEQAFVAKMNRRARTMGLTCTHFTTPHGLRDEGNYSCATDLASLARADLADSWIRQTASMKKAAFPFPIESGRLEVANNIYFVQGGLPQIPGAVVTGLKTGYTDPAGRCYVITAKRGAKEVGVVLLHSPDPFRQVPALLKRGFRLAG